MKIPPVLGGIFLELDSPNGTFPSLCSTRVRRDRIRSGGNHSRTGSLRIRIRSCRVVHAVFRTFFAVDFDRRDGVSGTRIMRPRFGVDHPGSRERYGIGPARGRIRCRIRELRSAPGFEVVHLVDQIVPCGGRQSLPARHVRKRDSGAVGNVGDSDGDADSGHHPGSSREACREVRDDVLMHSGHG